MDFRPSHTPATSICHSESVIVSFLSLISSNRTAEIGPQTVMLQSKTFTSPCLFERLVNATLEACDESDEVEDGVGSVGLRL